MAFLNPKRWSRENLFSSASIWDIPLIKPRFGCNYDMMLSQKGYDLGERLTQELEAFKLGLKCERGFREIRPSELSTKRDREFGVDGAFEGMPGLRDFRISVMYRTFIDGAKLFDMSVATVIKHFPEAHEIVVVVLEEDEALFEGILEGHRVSAPFPLRVVTEPEMMNGHVQQKYSKVRFRSVLMEKPTLSSGGFVRSLSLRGHTVNFHARMFGASLQVSTHLPRLDSLGRGNPLNLPRTD